MQHLPLVEPHYIDNPPRPRAGESDFLWKTYRWMSGGLALTGLVAWLFASTPSLVQAVLGNPVLFYGALIAELVMVFAFAARASQMSTGTAAAVFLAYAALNGVSMAAIFLAYTAASIGQAFFVCAVAFAALSVYGSTTRRDLSAMGSFMLVGLVGLVLASVVNIFARNAAIDWVITCAGVLIFAGLTAYDHQKLRRMYATQGGAGNLALQGALTLYLDFINLFIMLLRAFGRRR